ncbi:nucleotidyltransferase domain-containing protein [Clostridium estertheticum]|uniref:nucleotidyltransferase domain-containing protein n=1 Tax=Clostridium estertheticum TaxID=238834 RepID=UPI001C6EF3C3|nr:nucleotidyltransferase domain-containing protein [Clostridium estertheticum]MBW9153942.1 nucleotidyltransferase domain-containing protein [Clostridium estertheticum]WLC85571.1 nucleotidyltransferase domain-containing protein [Clostridium estertheticum]
MLKKDVYLDSINYFIDYIKSEKLNKKIVAVYLGGSVGRGDYSPGRSDIDIYIVNKEEDKKLENRLMKKAYELANTSLVELKETCDNPFTVAVTSIESIKNGNSWLGAGCEYFSFVENSKLLLGNDIKDILPIPNIEQIQETSKQVLQILISNMQEKPIINCDNKDSITCQVFSAIFSSIHLMLSYSGVYIRGKKEMTYSFQKLSKDNFLNSICADVFDLWNEFETNSLKDSVINKLMDDGKMFVLLGYKKFFIEHRL